MSSTTIQSPITRHADLSRYSRAGMLARPFKRGIACLAFRHRLRRALAEMKALDDRVLRDIGLSRGHLQFAALHGRPVDRFDDRLHQ